MPPEWTSVMRRIAVACDYFRRAARGDPPTEDNDSSKEEDDDDTDSDYEDEFESD